MTLYLDHSAILVDLFVCMHGIEETKIQGVLGGSAEIRIKFLHCVFGERIAKYVYLDLPKSTIDICWDGKEELERHRIWFHFAKDVLVAGQLLHPPGMKEYEPFRRIFAYRYIELDENTEGGEFGTWPSKLIFEDCVSKVELAKSPICCGLRVYRIVLHVERKALEFFETEKDYARDEGYAFEIIAASD